MKNKIQFRKFDLFLLVLALAFPVAANAGVAVSVSQPSSTTATVPTTTTINASASSSNPITGWHIYLDGNSVWSTNNTQSISAPISMSSGTHKLYVRAWDSSGAYGTSATYTLTASSSAPAPSTGTSTNPVVSVQSPTPGATVGSPVTFKATASSAYPITGFVVYANNANVLQQNAATLSGTASLGAGTYSVRVKAWNSKGYAGESGTFTITVGGTSSGGSTSGTTNEGLPVPPSTAKVFYNIEDGKYDDCTTCADHPDDSTPEIAQYSRSQWQSSPALGSNSTKFWIGGSVPYSQALHWTKFGNQSWAKNFLWEFWVYGKEDSYNAHVLEFDVWQAVGGRKYMFGSQCNYSKGIWQGWNEQLTKWVDWWHVPCTKFPAGKWTRVVWHVRRTSDNKLHYVRLVVGDKSYYVNNYQPTDSTSWADSSGVQFQQGLNKYANDYAIWVDKVKLTIW